MTWHVLMAPAVITSLFDERKAPPTRICNGHSLEKTLSCPVKSLEEVKECLTLTAALAVVSRIKNTTDQIPAASWSEKKETKSTRNSEGHYATDKVTLGSSLFFGSQPLKRGLPASKTNTVPIQCV